jgi:creatinine deaminase
MINLSAADLRFIELSFREAKASLDAGGLPIGSVLARGPVLVASGHNQRVQQGDPIAHGEMDALRKAGRQKTYRDTTLYTSLSPCMMCAGTIVQFGIPRVVINDTINFGGNEDFLRSHGVEVIDAAHEPSIQQMRAFIAAHPALWNEDIMD